MRYLRNSWRLAAAFLLLAAATGALFAFLPVRADMTILLPEHRNGDLALLFRTLREGPANRTVLMVEHNLSVVATLSNAITVLARGEILAEGDYATVSRNPQVVQAYMGSGDA